MIQQSVPKAENSVTTTSEQTNSDKLALDQIVTTQVSTSAGSSPESSSASLTSQQSTKPEDIIRYIASPITAIKENVNALSPVEAELQERNTQLLILLNSLPEYQQKLREMGIDAPDLSAVLAAPTSNKSQVVTGTPVNTKIPRTEDETIAALNDALVKHRELDQLETELELATAELRTRDVSKLTDLQERQVAQQKAFQDKQTASLLKFGAIQAAALSALETKLTKMGLTGVEKNKALAEFKTKQVADLKAFQISQATNKQSFQSKLADVVVKKQAELAKQPGVSLITRVLNILPGTKSTETQQTATPSTKQSTSPLIAFKPITTGSNQTLNTAQNIVSNVLQSLSSTLTKTTGSLAYKAPVAANTGQNENVMNLTQSALSMGINSWSRSINYIDSIGLKHAVPKLAARSLDSLQNGLLAGYQART